MQRKETSTAVAIQNFCALLIDCARFFFLFSFLSARSLVEDLRVSTLIDANGIRSYMTLIGARRRLQALAHTRRIKKGSAHCSSIDLAARARARVFLLYVRGGVGALSFACKEAKYRTTMTREASAIVVVVFFSIRSAA